VNNAQQPIGTRYQALKIYLMLGDPTHYSHAAIKDWYTTQWQHSASKNAVKKQLAILNEIKHSTLFPLPINQQLVNDSRNFFNALPANYLFYTLAKLHFPTDEQPIKIEGFYLAEQTIPAYYTKQGFHQVITDLPQITAQLKKENWVLRRQDLNQVSTIIEQAYSYDYMIWWRHFTKKTMPLPSQNFEQLSNNLHLMHQKKSFARLAELIERNTSPEIPNIGNLFNQEIASKFADFNLIGSSTITQLNSTLQDLEKLLITLSAIDDNGKTAFNLTKARFHNNKLTNPISIVYIQAEQLPEPLASWIKKLADNAWYMLINETKKYVNQEWKTLIYQRYQSDIANRFPFSTSVNEEVNLNAFNQFFSPKGLLKQFFKTNIEPFLDTSSPQWIPKQINGYQLAIHSDLINELIRANVISSMFFSPQSEQSDIAFTLQKLTIDPALSSVSLSIGDATLASSQSGDNDTKMFHWPTENANLTLKLLEGDVYRVTEQGPWAFFKLLKKVNVLSDQDNRANLQILFEINGNSGRYLLKTNKQLNPFMPGILNAFHLKETIA